MLKIANFEISETGDNRTQTYILQNSSEGVLFLKSITNNNDNSVGIFGNLFLICNRDTHVKDSNASLITAKTKNPTAKPNHLLP